MFNLCFAMKKIKEWSNLIIGNVNECSKGIDMKTIFENILWENGKAINFVDRFLYFP